MHRAVRWDEGPVIGEVLGLRRWEQTEVRNKKGSQMKARMPKSRQKMGKASGHCPGPSLNSEAELF